MDFPQLKLLGNTFLKMRESMPITMPSRFIITSIKDISMKMSPKEMKYTKYSSA